nr:glycine--tRNA ligase subunit beta [Desulfobacterales bacterium]
MSKDLLLEIFTEEIPTGYILPALRGMETIMAQKLSEARIEYGPMETKGTPRRLAIIVHDVAEKQESMVNEILGPPRRVAFDSDGRPTKAAEGFARSHGVSTDVLRFKSTPKGEYVCIRKLIKGVPTITLLKTILPDVILKIPFPKSMRWADTRISFARPIHSILALFGKRTVSFSLGNIKSGRRTFGHRFLHPKSVQVKDPSEYVHRLREAFVVVDITERKEMIRQRVSDLARTLGGKVLSDDELLDTVTQLVEFPAVVAGKFSPDFLEIPSEVLIAAMREHQKYFAVVDSQERLMPHFIAVNNTPTEDNKLVIKGLGRVLQARLEDARFFFEADTRTPLHSKVDQLKYVMFQANLGTVYEKVLRIQRLAEFLAEENAPETKDVVSRAAWLCKADLVSQMVGEFPKLQGIMGSIYAHRFGEPEAVATAIREHYLPVYGGGPLPKTMAGALLAIADKMDTICGCIGIGLIPTGTSDPYALRRQGSGIIHTMLEHNITLSLRELIQQSIRLLQEKIPHNIEEAVQNVLTFFEHRVEYLLIGEGYPKDLVAAVISVSIDDIPGVWARIKALKALKAKPNFDSLSIAFKRVVNIIKQAKERYGKEALFREDNRVNPDLFEKGCEENLYSTFYEVKEDALTLLKAGAVDRALLAVASLKQPVDEFFDGVMVMVQDDALRKNRLALLQKISQLFSLFADFSRIST